MSEQATIEAQEVSEPSKPDQTFPGSQFQERDLQSFSADDTQATTNIGKMLTLVFFYSLIAMMLVTLWTWSVSSS